MPEKSITAVLVVNTDPERRKQGKYLLNNFICSLIFKHAGCCGNDTVRVFLISPNDRLSLPVQSEGCVDLAPVMRRILHSDNWMQLHGESRQKLL